jgi:hypothetical protein
MDMNHVCVRFNGHEFKCVFHGIKLMAIHRVLTISWALITYVFHGCVLTFHGFFMVSFMGYTHGFFMGDSGDDLQ